MDLVRGIFKQKIAAFLLFFEVFPEYILNLPPTLPHHSPPGLKIAARERSLRVIPNEEENQREMGVCGVGGVVQGEVKWEGWRVGVAGC